MEFTENTNAALVNILNPVGYFVRTPIQRAFRWLNDLSRAETTDEKDRMRVQVRKKKIVNTFNNVPKTTEVEELLKQRGTEEERLRALLDPLQNNRPLSLSDEALLNDLKVQLGNNNALNDIKVESTKRLEQTTETIKQLKEEQEKLKEEIKTFKIKPFEISTKANTYVVDEATLPKHYDRLIELRQKETNNTLTKDERAELIGLNKVLYDYELFISDRRILQQALKTYEESLVLLNLQTTKLDDFVLNTIESLYLFKQYFNIYVDKDAEKILTDAVNYLNKKKFSLTTDKLEKETELNNKKSLLTTEVDENKKDKLTKDITLLTTTIGNITSELEKTNNELNNKEKELNDFKNNTAAGKKGPADLVGGFDADKHKRAVAILKDKAVNLVSFYNGLTLSIVVEDPVTKEKTTHYFNDSVVDPDKFFLGVQESGRVIFDVGITIKETFETRVSRLLNSFFQGTKDIYNDLLHINKPLFNVDPEQWLKLSEEEKTQLIVSFIIESDIETNDKRFLLEGDKVRKVKSEINRAYQFSKGSKSKFIYISNMDLKDLYRYAVQENIKQTSSNNPLAVTLKAVAEKIKEFDDLYKTETESIKDETELNRFLSLGIKENFEKLLKSSPVYKYVKAYIYDNFNTNSSDLSIFKKSALTQQLPKEIKDYDTVKALKSINIPNNMIDDLLKSEVTKAILSPFDTNKIRKFSQGGSLLELETLKDDEIEELSRQVDEMKNDAAEERLETLSYKEKSKKIFDTVKSDRSKFKNTNVVDLVLNQKSDQTDSPLLVTSQVKEDVLSLVTSKTENVVDESIKIIDDVLNKSNYIIENDRFTVSLKMRQLTLESTENKVSFISFLNSKNRSDIEYKEKVMLFAYELAELVKEYGNILSIKNTSITMNVEDIARVIYNKYLEDTEVKVEVSTKQSTLAKENFTDLFTKYLISSAKSLLIKNNIPKEDATNAEARKYLKQLVNDYNKDGSNKDTLLELFNATNNILNKQLSRSRESVVFVNTLKELINSVRNDEQSIVSSIVSKVAETNPSTTKLAYLQDLDVRALEEDFLKKPEDRDHLLFKVLNTIQKNLTEDYADKYLIEDFKNFTAMKVVEAQDKPDTIVFTLKQQNKEIDVNVFDLVFSHSISYNDFIDVVNDVTSVMAKTYDAKQLGDLAEIRSKAIAEFNRVVQTWDTILSYNTLAIDEEVFMRQPGATPTLYKIFSNPVINAVRKRLTITNSIYKVNETNEIPFNTFLNVSYAKNYKNKIQEFYNTATNAVSSGTGYAPFIAFKDSEGNDLFKIRTTNKENQLRSLETLNLLALIELSKGVDPNVKAEDAKLIIRNVFFKDVKDVRGLAQQTRLDAYKKLETKAVAELEAYKNDANNVGRNNYKFVLTAFQNRAEVYRKLQVEYKDIHSKLGINPKTNEGFELFYKELLTNDNGETAESFFNNIIDTDSDKYVLGEKGNGETGLVRRAEVKTIQNKGEGIPLINNLLINYVFGKNNNTVRNKVLERVQLDQSFDVLFKSTWELELRKKVEDMRKNMSAEELINNKVPLNEKDLLTYITNYKEKTIPIITEGGRAIVVVPDDKWSLKTMNEDRETYKQILNGSKTNYDVLDVYILSETKYK